MSLYLQQLIASTVPVNPKNILMAQLKTTSGLKKENYCKKARI